jgi:phage FluMu gp28-like protein
MTAPAIFLPYQQRWVADKSPVKVIEKSRRIGLSWAESGDDVLYAAEAAGDDVWYIGYNKDMAEEYISDCAAWVKKYGAVAESVEEEIISDEGKDILAFRIRFASDNKIVALSSRPSNLRGKQGRVVIDEAAFHDNLRELIKAAIALLMWGGQVRIISTHDGDANYFNEIIQDIRAGRLPYSLHRVTLDDALAEGLYQRICLVKNQPWSQPAEDAWRQSLIDFYGDAAEEELFCIPSQGSGTYLTRVLIEGCMSELLPVIRYSKPDEFKYLAEETRRSEVDAWCEDTLAPLIAELDDNRRCYFGEDFGRSGDLSVIIPLQEQQDATFAAVFVLELRNMPFKQQEQILFYIVDRLPRFTHGALDARGNGQFLAEVAAQRYGETRISEVMLSDKWYREAMPRYKAAFEDKTILLPKDADIIEDHRAVKMIKGVAKLPETKSKGSDKGQRHGDSAVAGAMSWYATTMEGEAVYAYDSVVRREAPGDDSYRQIKTTAGFGAISGAM